MQLELFYSQSYSEFGNILQDIGCWSIDNMYKGNTNYFLIIIIIIAW